LKKDRKGRNKDEKERLEYKKWNLSLKVYRDSTKYKLSERGDKDEERIIKGWTEKEKLLMQEK